MGAGGSRAGSDFAQIIDGLLISDSGGFAEARAALSPFFELPKSCEEMFEALSLEAVKKLRDKRPGTVAAVIVNVVYFLEDCVDVAEYKPGTSEPLIFRTTGEDTTRIANALRLLGRVLPVVLEGGTTQGSWAMGLFGTGALAAHFEAAEGESGRKEDTVVPMTPPTELNPKPPPSTGSRLVNALLNLSATAGFTLHPDAAETPIWAVGVSTVSSVPPATQKMIENRTELMRVMLALCTQALYLPSEEYQNTPQPLTAFLATATPPHPAATTLLISMINTVLGYDPAAGSWYWNYWTKDAGGVLFDATLQALLAMLDYRCPGEGGRGARGPPGPPGPAGPSPGVRSAGHNVNVFQALFERISYPPDLAFIYNGLVRLVQNPVEIHQDPYKVKRKVDTFSEVLVLTWRCLEGSRALLEYATSPAAGGGLALLEPIMALVWMAREDASRAGLVHCGVFILLLLSSQRNFAVALNTPISSTPGIRLIGGLEAGTHADCLVHVFHELIFRGGAKVFPLFSTILTVLTNVTPFIKGFSEASSRKMVAVLEYFSAPSFLFAAPHNYGYAKYMLEAINNTVQHQPDGNAHLVHAILRARAVVGGLINLGLPADAGADSGGGGVTWAPGTDGGAVEGGGAGAGGQRFEPTQEWLAQVRAQLPTTVLQRLLAGLMPGLEAYMEQTGAASEEQVLDYLRLTTLVGLVPVPKPIVVRKYKPNSFTDLWFSAYFWGLVFLGQRETPLAFLDSRAIRLFQVAYHGGEEAAAAEGGEGVVAAVE